MQSYQLKPHVRACRDGATIVFLDLRRDRYSSVSAHSAPCIDGLTDNAVPAEDKAARLVSLGLIEPSTDRAAVLAPRNRAPDQKLVYDNDVVPTFLDAISFASACQGAAHSLSKRRLDLTLDGIARRKARVRGARDDKRAVLGCFEVLRPWYPRTRVCLFDSLALMCFMLSRNLKPDLVLGVRTSPFAAHCWLELDGELAGDTSDHCASFTPIAWV